MLKNFIKLLIIFIISILIGNMAYGMYREAKIGDGPNQGTWESNEIDKINTLEMNTLTEQTNEIDNSNRITIKEEYNGYKVSARLIIPEIDLETYVLDSDAEEAMWLCPTKYFGPEPNEVGNYCIAAHNYDKENMFNHIIELEKGDKIFLLDNKHGQGTYQIYDIYKVKPSETQVLSQETNGETELTLITCSDYSSKRIIVKARKV